MLQSIRDRTHGWIAGVIISLLILSFALWGIHSYLEAGSSNNIVAKVNGVAITKSQLAVAYDRLRQQAQLNSNDQLSQITEAALKNQALQTLIEIQVLRQASLNQDYRISSLQIDNFLESIPEFQVNGEFSLAKFQQALSASLFTASDFLDLIKTNLLINQPRLGLIFTSYALPNEVMDTIALVGQERSIRYGIFPKEFITTDKIQVTDAEINTYYEQHQNEFKTPEQVKIDYITLAVKDLMNTIHPNDEQLKNYYNENSNAFAESPAWQLEALSIPLDTDKLKDILAAANAQQSFPVIAKQYSLTLSPLVSSKKWMTSSEIPSDLQKSVLTLTKVGQLSAPVKTSSGFIVLKVTGYKEAKVQPFERVKEKVREAVARQAAEEQFSHLKEQLANITYEHPETLAVAAKQLNLPIKTSELFSKAKGTDDVSGNVKVREMAFSNDVLNLQNNSDLVQMGPETVLVMRVKSHLSASLLPLTAVKSQIIEKITNQLRQAQLEQLANQVTKDLQKGTLSLDSVTEKYHVKWVDAGSIGRHATNVDQAILDTAFEMPKPTNVNAFSFAATQVPNGYAIVALSHVEPGNQTKISREQYQAFAEQIQTSEGLLEYELYKQGIIKKAKIVQES